jgi:hypothetical protein
VLSSLLAVQAGLASVESVHGHWGLLGSTVCARAVELIVALFLIPLLHGRELEMVVGIESVSIIEHGHGHGRGHRWV